MPDPTNINQWHARHGTSDKGEIKEVVKILRLRYVSPSCGDQNFFRLGATRNFDRCASFCSLYPPQAAGTTSPRVTKVRTPPCHSERSEESYIRC